MSIPVKIFRSTDPNAPTLNGTAGSLIALFDACLVNGYNSKAVQSITRSGQTATVTFATAHGLNADALTVVRHAGFDQAEYNGDFRISNVLTNSYDITVTGSPATPGTGTATSKVAPVDWVKAYSGTNKGAYRSNALDATRLFLRVDDNNPAAGADSGRTAYVRGYETMSDVDTGYGPFPTVAQGQTKIIKSTIADSSSREWIMIADDREMLLFYSTRAGTAGQYQQRTFHFGDFASELPSDPYGCLIMGTTNPTISYNNGDGDNYEGYNAYKYPNTPGASALSGHYVARPYSQIGSSTGVAKVGFNLYNSSYFGYQGYSYPTAGNNQLYLAPVFISEMLASMPIRGVMKCWYDPMHVKPLGHRNTTSDVSGLPGRTLMAIAISMGQNNDTVAAEVHIDITGPWR